MASVHNESDYYGGGEVLSSSSANSEDSSAQLLDEGLLFSEMTRFVHDDNGTSLFQNDVNVVWPRDPRVVMTRERYIRRSWG